jgi:hypothetical protein
VRGDRYSAAARRCEKLCSWLLMNSRRAALPSSFWRRARLLFLASHNSDLMTGRSPCAWGRAKKLNFWSTATRPLDLPEDDQFIEQAKPSEFACEMADRVGIFSRFRFRVEVLHPVDLAAETAQRLDVLKVNSHVAAPLRGAQHVVGTDHDSRHDANLIDKIGLSIQNGCFIWTNRR